MKLPDTIRAYTADLRHRFRGKTWHAGNPGPPLDDLDLAADIIDSLPKAEDGSPIWRGCWCVLRVGCTVHITRCWGYDAVEQRGWFGDNEDEIDDVWFTIEGASEVRSTHRTREEAEAAAAKAGEWQSC